MINTASKDRRVGKRKLHCMTVQTKEQPRDAWAAEDEIDLRQYLDVLIRWWREIVAITLGAVVLAAVGILLMRLVLPPKYEASADVAIVRTVSDVNFDERFRTNPEQLGVDTISLSARRSALLGLVATGTIAHEVIEQLGDTLSTSEKNPAKLLEMVEAQLANTGSTPGDSDLIRITIAANDPDKAAAIANAWAPIFVRTVNTIYGQVPNEVLASIQAELNTAEQSYLANQAKLETFIATNRVDALTNLVAVLQKRVNQEVLLQEAFLNQWQEAQEQLATARALRVQVEQGGDGATRSSMAAVQILKMSAYGMAPENLQIEVRDLPEVNQQALLTDIDGLITSLDQRLKDLALAIGSRSDTLNQAEGAATQTDSTSVQDPTAGLAYQQLRDAKAQLEAETARQQQLIQQRDLSWETYKTLSNKVAELNLTRAAASSDVRFGAPAVPSVNSVQRINLVLGLVIGGTFGLFLAVLYAFLVDYLGKTPFGVSTKPKTV